MFGDTPLEAHPDDEQRARLQDFLLEVMFVSRKYGMLIACETPDEPPVVLDVQRDTIVGIDFGYVVDETDNNAIKSYWCADSILDGVWIVEREDGSMVEQQYWHHDPAPRSGQ